MARLYRPVGLKEMELILNTESKKFPPRLPSQPIFYPVLNINYAKQIASDWNTADINSGFVGYVTEFEVDDVYISQYKVQNVGTATHDELWIPADNLKEFNDNIIGNIIITEAFYGMNYNGLPNTKEVKEQLILLNQKLSDNKVIFQSEVALQWKVMLLNLIYWYKLDLTQEGINENSKIQLLTKIYDTLKQNRRAYIKDIFQ